MTAPEPKLPSADAPPLLMHLSGRPELRCGSRHLVLERKAAAALAWLALRGPVRRDRLAQALWPAADAAGQRNNLRQLVFRLKKAMDTSVIEGSDELALAAGLRRAPDAPGAQLLEGIDLGDCPELATWLGQVRAAHHAADQAARLAQAAAAEAQGDHAQAASLARALLGEDPLLEPAHRQLIRAHYLSGDRTAALSAGEACEAALREGMGAAPDAATRALLATVRAADAPAPTPTPRIPVAVLRPPRLIGRETARTALRRAADEGRIALLQGEPGMGKSRLLAEVLPPPALQVSARPGDAGVPFATLARLLRSRLAQDQAPEVPAALRTLLPERPEPSAAPGMAVEPAASGGRDARLALQQAVAAWLAQGSERAHVVLDDLHFADESSVELLHALLDDDRLAHWRWTLARRPAEGGAASQRLVHTLADDGRLARIDLQPLDEAHITELLALMALPGLQGAALASSLHRRTGGNPLFVLETLKAMLTAGVDVAVVTEGADRTGQPLPAVPGLAALIERRLRQLSPLALSLARVAALAGPDFDTDLAVAVLGVPLMSLADAWAELEAAQVLRDQAFAHDLIFETVWASVPPAIGRHARRAIAQHLEPRQAEPARLAAHWEAAGDPARAAPCYHAAGRRAEAAASYADAEVLFEHAARCHRLAGQPGHALQTMLDLVDLLVEARRPQDALAVLDRLQPMQVNERLQVARARMPVLLHLGRRDEAIATGRRLLADPEVQDEATPRSLAEMRHKLVDMLLSTGRLEEAQVELQRIAPVFAEDPDPQWRGWFHSDQARALLMATDLRGAERHQQIALAAAREVGRQRMIAGCLQLGARIATEAGQAVQALERIDECLLLMRDAGEDLLTRVVRSQRATPLLDLGRFRVALPALEEACSEDWALRHLANLRCINISLLVRLWLHLGQVTRAQVWLPVLAAEAPHRQGQAAWRQARADWRWWTGKDPAAQLAGDDDAPEDSAGADPGAAVRQTLLAWRAELDRVNPEEVAVCRARWDACGQDGAVLAADVVAAHVAWRRGDSAAAAALAGQALQALRRSTPPGLYRPWLLLRLAEASRQARPDLATRAVREGLDWVQSVLRFHVPEPFRDSFLHGNAVNVELLQQARTHGLASA